VQRGLAKPAGTGDTLSGTKGTARLTGQDGWKEIDGCPVFTNDQADLANRQMADVFTANPERDAFVLEGGWARFAPQAYSQVTGQVLDRLKSKALAIVAGDTVPPQLEAPSVMLDLINGKKVNPVIYTGLDECTQENVATCIAR
jgi:ribose transport system substrate-binding protein